jgi:hypothetical protein
MMVLTRKNPLDDAASSQKCRVLEDEDQVRI